MPSGSGGGGGGGGYYGGGYGGYYHYRGSGGKCNWCHVLVAWVIIFPAAIAITVILVLVLLPPFSNPAGSDIYASRDTALLRYSSDLCDSLRVSIGSEFSEGNIQVTLYLLEHKPTNTRRELISFARTPVIVRQYRFWFFHLLPNSRIILTACTQTSELTFYFIKGTGSFNQWDRNPARHFDRRIQVEESCPASGNNNKTFFQYDVESDDQYYMVFYNKDSSSTLELTFNITQILHTVSSDMVTDNCSIFDYLESCSLPVAYSSSHVAFLQVEPVEGSVIDWDASNVVRLNCHRRVWVYALISVFSVIGIVLLSVTVPLVIYAFFKRDELSGIKCCKKVSATAKIT